MDQIKIILFDELVENPKEVYSQVLDFLELPYAERESFDVVNENAVTKYRVAQGFLKKEFPITKKIRIALKNTLNIEEIGFRSYIDNITKTKTKREPMNLIVKKRVIENYRLEVERLEELLSRDLSSWNIP